MFGGPIEIYENGKVDENGKVSNENGSIYVKLVRPINVPMLIQIISSTSRDINTLRFNILESFNLIEDPIIAHIIAHTGV